MDDLFLKRVLFEWLRDRYKEQANIEITSLNEIADCVTNLFIFQRLAPVLSLRAPATSSRVLKKDYPWSDYLQKTPRPIKYFVPTSWHVLKTHTKMNSSQ